MLTTHQAAWLLAGLGASSLANSTGYLWTQRVNSNQAFIILWVLLGVCGGAFAFGGLLSAVFHRRRVWQWAAWFTCFAVGTADILYVWEFGLFGVDWTFALAIAVVATALVLSLLGIIIDDWRRNRAAKVGSSTSQRREVQDNICTLSGMLAVACALVLCGLSAAMFADVMLEFEKLAANDSLRDTASLVKWIVIGINGGMVLILALWFFVAGARDAVLEEKAIKAKPYTPPAAVQVQSAARTQTQMATRPDEYIMGASMASPAQANQSGTLPMPAPATVSAVAVSVLAAGMQSTGTLKPNSAGGSGLRTMTCTRNYRAVERDELTLTVGDKVALVNEYLDGWALGRVVMRNGQLGTEGVFPLVVCVHDV